METESMLIRTAQEDESKAGFINILERGDIEEFFNNLIECRGIAADPGKKVFDENKVKTLEKTWTAILTLKPFPSTDRELRLWLVQPAENLFTWNDYSEAYYKCKILSSKVVIRTNDKSKPDQIKIKAPEYPTWHACYEIIYAYFMLTKRHEEESWTEFFSHPPFDYTRPHGWYDHPGYISVGEALEALIDILSDQTADLKASQKTLFLFQQQYQPPHFPEVYFPQITKLSDLRIPYKLYAKCWDDAQSTTTIMPFSIEICVYYVLQNGLEARFFHTEKALKTESGLIPELYYLLPSYKYMDSFDLMRHLTLWNIWLKTFQNHQEKWDFELYKEHCSYFRFTEYELSNDFDQSYLFWHGVSLRNPNVTYRDTLTQAFQFFGDLLNGISFALVLQSQLHVQDVQSLPQNQQDLNKKCLKSTEKSMQKLMLTDLLEKFENIMKWLDMVNDKHKKGENVDIKPPVWECDADGLYAFIQFIPRTPITLHLEKVLKNEENKPINAYIFKKEMDGIERNLKDSALANITKGEEESLKHALHGMTSVLPKIRPHHYLLHGLKITHPQSKDHLEHKKKKKILRSLQEQDQKKIKIKAAKLTGKADLKEASIEDVLALLKDNADAPLSEIIEKINKILLSKDAAKDIDRISSKYLGIKSKKARSSSPKKGGDHKVSREKKPLNLFIPDRSNTHMSQEFIERLQDQDHGKIPQLTTIDIIY